MVTVETLLDVVPTVSLIVVLAYYAMQIKILNKNRRLQMIQQLWDWISTEEGYSNLNELMTMKWEDYEDFNRRYGAENNPDSYAKRFAVWRKMNGLGYLVKEGAVDVETVYEHAGGRIIWMWMKFEPIVQEIQKNFPYIGKWWEYLAKELQVVQRRR
ncbi:MAG: hypothetical protein JSV27_11275 [Candidatus Bathyarchaeota archaeon]|nr:MAG: hypothetical protein JSV27_11275 [Candidatus Bathyarchaeota archaeon]